MTWETVKQILTHNSVLDSLKADRKVVYGDNCAKKPEPKTS